MAKYDPRDGGGSKSGAGDRGGRPGPGGKGAAGGKGGKSSKGGKGPADAAPSQRMLRIAELIRHKLAEMLTRGEIHDDVLARAIITVPEVRLASDLKTATVYIMPLGGGDAKPVVEALEKHKKYIRSGVAKAINLKYAPELKFKLDETFAEADRIGKLLASPKVRQDLE
jgi:ribosome-binding factor A